MEFALRDLPPERRRHVESRLRDDVIAWLTTVRPSGQPDSVPVWFLWDGERVLIYSRQAKTKLRSLASNPKVTVVLDDTNEGYDVVRVEGVAEQVEPYPAVHEVPAYVEKYAERIRSIGWETPENFGRSFSVAILVTPTKVRGFQPKSTG